MLKICRNLIFGSSVRGTATTRLLWSRLSSTTPSGSTGTEVDLREDNAQTEPPIPEYVERQGEAVEVLRARLQYQSRKRGTLENGLLLSSFCSRYLNTFTGDQLAMYDKLINKPSNDWDIFYWVIGTKPTPPEFENEVLALLRKFAKNSEKEVRVTMPALTQTWP
jgi:succinate dehydrogenase assembly factor 2